MEEMTMQEKLDVLTDFIETLGLSKKALVIFAKRILELDEEED